MWGVSNTELDQPPTFLLLILPIAQNKTHVFFTIFSKILNSAKMKKWTNLMLDNMIIETYLLFDSTEGNYGILTTGE